MQPNLVVIICVRFYTQCTNCESNGQLTHEYAVSKHGATSVQLGSSTETVAFQVYEILKIDHEFLQFF